MLRFALLCFALLCFVLLCFALLCFALLCFALMGGRFVVSVVLSSSRRDSLVVVDFFLSGASMHRCIDVFQGLGGRPPTLYCSEATHCSD